MRFEVQACEHDGRTVYVAIIERYVDRGTYEERRSLDLLVTNAFNTFSELGLAIEVIQAAIKSNDFSEADKLLASEIRDLDLYDGWSAWNCGNVVPFYKNKGDIPHICMDLSYSKFDMHTAFKDSIAEEATEYDPRCE